MIVASAGAADVTLGGRCTVDEQTRSSRRPAVRSDGASAREVAPRRLHRWREHWQRVGDGLPVEVGRGENLLGAHQPDGHRRSSLRECMDADGREVGEMLPPVLGPGSSGDPAGRRVDPRGRDQPATTVSEVLDGGSHLVLRIPHVLDEVDHHDRVKTHPVERVVIEHSGVEPAARHQLLRSLDGDLVDVDAEGLEALGRWRAPPGPRWRSPRPGLGRPAQARRR